MTPTEQNRAFLVRLRTLQAGSLRRFEILRKAGKVAGEFTATTWVHAGRRLHFVVRSGPRDASSRRPLEPLRGVAGILARCFIVASVEEQLSAEAVYGRLFGVRWLAEVTGGGTRRWLSLTPAVLNRVVANVQREQSAATVYNRAGAIASFIGFLNRTRTGSGEHASSLLGRHIIWKPGLKNPIRPSIEFDFTDTDALGQRKFVPELHRALGSAHSRIKLNPELEPRPGYDLIRLEALTFAMSTGMRVGELCALSLGCLETHESTGTPFLRVPTEKGQPPSARPIAEIWADPVSHAYDYLLERCSGARSRAREIEEKGFAFVTDALRTDRMGQPVPPGLEAQLEVLGLEMDRYFQIRELTDAFSLTSKEFMAGGRFSDCTVDLPRIVAARVVRWMDARMVAWDWPAYSEPRTDARTGQVGTRLLSARQVASYIGGGRACLPKARWFYPQLRRLLIGLSKAGALEGTATSGEIEKLRGRWADLRQKALSHRGGGQCTAVDIEKFIAALAARHRSHLEQHYKEIVSYDGEGAPVPAAGARLGVPDALSDHLIVLWESEFSGRGQRGILPRPIFRSDFYNYLSSNAQKQTVFERLKILDNTGKPFSISPHQIRHWVTTAIFRSGPSEMMVDLWMGRSPGQSRTYDHRTARERAEAMRKRYLSGSSLPDDYLGRRVRVWREGGFSAEELETLVSSRLRVLHFVPWGGCSRELFSSPCNRGLMCLRGFGTNSACPSFHVDVSDGKARANIVALRDQYRAMFAALYPMASTLEEVFKEELNSSEALDQHLIHMREVLRGCDQALAAYANAGTCRSGAAKIVPVGVMPR